MKIQCDCGEWITQGIVKLDDGDFVYQCPNCGSGSLDRLLSAFSVVGSRTSESTTCCGRDTPCDSPPCSADNVCRRR